MIDINYFIIKFSLVFIVIIISIIIHELGHVIMIKHYGRKPVLSFKKGSILIGFDKKGLKINELKNVYLVGIISGLIVVIIAIIIDYMLFMSLILYMVGCRSDNQQIFKLSIKQQELIRSA